MIFMCYLNTFTILSCEQHLYLSLSTSLPAYTIFLDVVKTTNPGNECFSEPHRDLHVLFERLHPRLYLSSLPVSV
jgi:hypothetical protein